jgi:large subunit ribosomal protein L31e
MAEPAKEEEERIYTIPLRKYCSSIRTKQAVAAIKAIKKFISRHMKTSPDNVWLDTNLNEYIWSRGIQKIPPRIRVNAIKFEDELVEVSLSEEEKKQ